MAVRGDIFGSVPVSKIGRTNFNLSHQVTGNFKEAICYPVVCCETLPGDSWKINTYNITKLETLIAPAMQRTDASLLWFKIPQRLCMKQFKKWYSGGIDGKSSVEKPYVTLQSFCDWIEGYLDAGILDSGLMSYVVNEIMGPGSLWQCLGLPCPVDYVGSTPKLIMPFTYDEQGAAWSLNWNFDILSQKIDLIPFTAYQLLFDDFFRDQTLSDPIFQDDPSEYPLISPRKWYLDEDIYINCDGTANVFEGGEKYFSKVWPLFLKFRRAWKKDYFTSALPTPQRGPEVTLDMFAGQSAPINAQVTSGSIDGLSFTGIDENDQAHWLEGEAEFTPVTNGGRLKDQYGNVANGITGNFDATIEGSADLSGLSPITIVALRNLFKLQAFMEKNNVAGGRYIEYILAHWAERVPDFTVQRPVFVRATKIPVIVSEVTATANSSGVNSQVGDQGGRAKAQGNLGKCSMYTQEPSIILGIYCVTIPPSYVMQGIPKMFQRMSHWDCPYNEFQSIGEQAIANKEIFLDWKGTSDVGPDDDFGYQQRYAELKYLPDRVIGDFSTSLAYWNQARIFTDQPALNQDFIEQKPSERIFAVENQNPVIADFWFDIKCSRKLSKYSTPKLS